MFQQTAQDAAMDQVSESGAPVATAASADISMPDVTEAAEIITKSCAVIGTEMARLQARLQKKGLKPKERQKRRREPLAELPECKRQAKDESRARREQARRELARREGGASDPSSERSPSLRNRSSGMATDTDSDSLGYVRDDENSPIAQSAGQPDHPDMITEDQIEPLIEALQSTTVTSGAASSTGSTPVTKGTPCVFHPPEPGREQTPRSWPVNQPPQQPMPASKQRPLRQKHPEAHKWEKADDDTSDLSSSVAEPGALAYTAVGGPNVTGGNTTYHFIGSGESGNEGSANDAPIDWTCGASTERKGVWANNTESDLEDNDAMDADSEPEPAGAYESFEVFVRPGAIPEGNEDQAAVDVLTEENPRRLVGLPEAEVLMQSDPKRPRITPVLVPMPEQASSSSSGPDPDTSCCGFGRADDPVSFSRMAWRGG